MSVIIDRKSLKSSTGGQFKADKGGKGFTSSDMSMSGRKASMDKRREEKKEEQHKKNGKRKDEVSTSTTVVKKL